MKRLVVLMTLISGSAYASEVSCEKKPMNDHIVHCKTKKDIEVALIKVNGGECVAPAFHKRIPAGGSFDVPGTKECYHTRSIMLSIDHTLQLFAPL